MAIEDRACRKADGEVGVESTWVHHILLSTRPGGKEMEERMCARYCPKPLAYTLFLTAISLTRWSQDYFCFSGREVEAQREVKRLAAGCRAGV